MPGGTVVPAEPFGNEAHSFVKEMILQREVDIQVEGMDKGGNFIGWCFEGSTNLSLALVDEGFASSFIMGDKSGYGNQVWSLTQFYSVDFSQSRIGVNKCVF